MTTTFRPSVKQIHDRTFVVSVTVAGRQLDRYVLNGVTYQTAVAAAEAEARSMARDAEWFGQSVKVFEVADDFCRCGHRESEHDADGICEAHSIRVWDSTFAPINGVDGCEAFGDPS